MASIFPVFLLMIAIFQNVAAQTCGGNLTGSGRITSPNYPYNYPDYESCIWTLTVDETTGTGKSISLFIEDLFTQEDSDFVEIYSDGNLIERYSGLVAPQNSVYGRSITVYFRTDYDGVTRRGFSIFFNSTGHSCGESLTGSGRFTSPNYPGNYPDSVKCQWTLTAAETTGIGSSISLFIEAIRLDDHNDALEIYSKDILMARYQGVTAAHKSVYGSSITVVFRSDNSGSQSGFLITFNSTGPECGRSCSDTGCFFWTPNFPYPYPTGSHCEWTYENDEFIAFEPTALSATPFTGQLKIISLFSGEVTTETFKSPTPMPDTTILNSFVAVNFTSDRCHAGQGFLLSLTRKTSRCGEHLDAEGTFSTPNYPFEYLASMICVWRLTASTGQRIELTVNDLRVENYFDYVRVYSDNVLVGSYTGDIGSFTLTLGSIVFVEFQSDAMVNGPGLDASFVSV